MSMQAPWPSSAKPTLQAHVKEPSSSVQVALSPQTVGSAAHSSTSWPQSAPVNPVAHSQEKLAVPSVQVPPLRQGLGVQSSVLVSQVSPSNPSAQSHTNVSPDTAHAPAFWHGFGSHAPPSGVQPPDWSGTKFSGQPHNVSKHTPEAQSLGAAQAWPSAHAGQSPPPQSVAVSCPLRWPSVQSGPVSDSLVSGSPVSGSPVSGWFVSGVVAVSCSVSDRITREPPVSLHPASHATHSRQAIHNPRLFWLPNVFISSFP